MIGKESTTCTEGIVHCFDKNKIDAKIDFIEYLGSEMNIHLAIQSNSFTARVSQSTNVKSDTSLSVVFDVNQGHFFDMENENIL